MARLYQRVVEDPRPCTYLPGAEAQLEVKLMLDVSPAELDELLERGWRHFGPVYFRPLCADCHECVTLRIPVETFQPSRNQRRSARRSARFRREVGPPRVDDERLALYARWHAEREVRRGWDASELDGQRYLMDFALPQPFAREAAFYDDAQGGRLVGVGIFDHTPRALSAVYFFHDPALERESLGTANVLALIDDARRLGLPWVYLGYLVGGCASLRYKSYFLPHELLIGRPAPTEMPRWRPGARVTASADDESAARD